MQISFKGITQITGTKEAREACLQKLDQENTGISMQADQNGQAIYLDKEDVVEICKTKFNLDLPDIFATGNEEQIQEYAAKNPEIIETLTRFGSEILSDVTVLIKSVFEYFAEKEAAGAEIKRIKA